MIENLRVRSSRDARNAWAGATEHELREAAENLRSLTPGFGTEWQRDVEAPVDGDLRPTPAQRVALSTLASGSIAGMRVRWDGRLATPATLEALGYVRRSAAASQVWDAFVSARGDTLRAVFGADLARDLRLAGTDRIGTFDVLRFVRVRDGVTVMHETLDAWVTTPASRLGEGVLWRVQSRWTRDLAPSPSAPRPSWLTDLQARAHVRDGGRDPLGSELYLMCARECVPVWQVQVAADRVVTLDARTGARLSQWNPMNNIGPLTQQGYPPGQTAPQTIRLRNAAVYRAAPAGWVGATNRSTGTHNFSQNESFLIGLHGSRTASTPWPSKRISIRCDNANCGGSDALLMYQVTWNPSLNPSSFNPSNPWSSNNPSFPNQYPHSAEVAYGWYAYWMSLFTDQVDVEVPDTLQIRLDPILTANYPTIAPRSGGAFNFSDPGAGQQTSGRVIVSITPSDNIGPIGGSMQVQDTLEDAIWTAAHEMGHVMIHCAAQPGYGCQDRDPNGTASTDPQRANPSAWRGYVRRSLQEDGACGIAQILTEFRYDIERFGVPYLHDYTFASYDDPNDSFTTPTSDAAGGGLCTPASGGSCTPSAPNRPCCPATHVCRDPNPNSPAGVDQSMCTRWCFNNGMTQSCPDGFSCPATGTLRVCQPAPDRSRVFTNTIVRLSMTSDWSSALKAFLTAMSGNDNNGLRDYVGGADNWYDHLTNATAAQGYRYELSRAIDSVYTSTLARHDDFPDRQENAAAIPSRSYTAVPIWWGNGNAAYPRFEDYDDFDVVLFRGLQGSRYEVAATARPGSAAVPRIYVQRWVNGQVVGDGTGSTVTTQALPATDWYAVVFYNAAFTSGDWEGTFRVTDTSDDVGDTLEEAYPAVSGVAVEARSTLSAGGGTDQGDAFQIDVPVSTPLTIATTAPSAWIDIYRPDGSWQTGGFSPLVVSPTPTTGAWVWKVFPSSDGTYTTTATLACAASGCDTAGSTRTVRYSWGDRFARRGLAAAGQDEYVLSLDAGQYASFAVTDTDAGCALRMEVFAPTSIRYFANFPVVTWADGAATSNLAGDTQGVGGSIAAALPGNYRVRVHNEGTTACPLYRIHLAKSSFTTNPMPEW